MSTACHLAMRGAANNLRVAVVEKDSSYRQASAVLSAGGLRQQFSLEQNIKMSLYGLEFMRMMQSWPSSDDVQFHQQGYVFMANTDSGAQTLRQNHEVQTQAGADIQLLEPPALKAKYPWMETSDIKLASFGRSGEGWLDPWTLLKNMRHRAAEGGVTFINASLRGLSLGDSGAVLHASVEEQGGRVEKLHANSCEAVCALVKTV